MQKITPTDPEAKSQNLIANNIAQLKALFPEVVAEGKIDFKVLQDILGEEVEFGDEYYRFTWAGKAKARQEAHKPSTGTLRPVPEESAHKDGTPYKKGETFTSSPPLGESEGASKNLYIEGDNLEVLKLLQKSYAGKVKMIYIDPPYNTGKDFVYKDNYKDNLGNYLEQTGQVDEEGRKLSTNSDSDGRYHSNWLNMIYPRLRLARNLLREDGVIFMSIDDNEVENLKKVGNEVFGEENFVAEFIWKKKQGGGNDSNHIVVEHEYIVCFTKDINSLELLLDKNYKLDDNLYPFKDEKGEYGLITLDKSSIRYSDSLVFEIKDSEGNSYYPRIVKGKQSCWRWGKEKVKNEFKDLVFKNGKVYTKYYRPDGITPKSLLVDTLYGRTETGNDDIKRIFDNQKPFSYPKPLSLVGHFFMISTQKNDLILDFFSGSATTAHAVMQLNAEDGGQRQHIQVQLPEATEEKSEAYKAGYKTIAEIGKERIRRAGAKILSEKLKVKSEKEALLEKEKNADKRKALEEEIKTLQSTIDNLDIGFKVFKLDTSNIKAWDGDAENLEANLLDAIENIKADRSEEDVLYEILLKYGLDLTLPIEEKEIAGCTVYSIGFGALFICLSEDIKATVAEGIGQWKEELAPEVCRVIFRDSGFTADKEKTNAVQTLKRFGVNEVRSI